MTRESPTGERLHIAILGHTAVTSGGELALVRVLPALLADEELLITVVLAEDGPLVAILRSLGARVVVLPLVDAVRSANRHETQSAWAAVGAAGPLLAYVRRLASFLRAERVDLVHTNTLKSAVYGGVAGRLARIPVLWHLRDRMAADYLPARTARAIGLLGRVLPRRVAVNSHTTAATLPTGLAARIQVVPDCIELPEIQPRTEAGRDQGRTLWIGMMARLAPWKGQHVLIEAFQRAFSERDDVKLALVGSAMFGESDYELQLKEQVERLHLGDRVEFRGFRPDIWAEYAGFDIAVHASVIPEPFGQVVIEAMAAGLPVVAADAGGPAEIITDGTDGLLTPPDDSEVLSRTLQRLVDDPDLRRQLGRAGRHRAADFSPSATAGELIDLYRRSTRRKPIRPGAVRADA